MATRHRSQASGKKSFLAKLRGQESQKKKTVNVALEKMVDALLEDAISTNSNLSFSEKMVLGNLALKIEAVRNKIGDGDFGTGFLDDIPDEPAGDEPELPAPSGE